MESEKWLLANTKDREFKFLCAFLTSIPNNLQEKIRHLSSMIKEIDPKKQGEINLSMWTSDNTQGTFKEKKKKLIKITNSASLQDIKSICKNKFYVHSQ